MDLSQYRSEFPILERYVYLNHAGVAPCSSRVRDAVTAWTRELAEHGLEYEARWQAVEASARERAARLLGATAGEIALTRNTSQGLSFVAEGLDWKAGDQVCVCTAEEYPSNVYPWQHLAHRGVEVREIAPKNGGVTTGGLEAAMTERTRLVSVSAVQYASGHATPLAEIGSLCRDRGVLLCVDGIQAVGAVDLKPKQLGVHFLSADSHKWMLGISGIGFLFVDESVIERVRPVVVGWKSTTGAFDFDRAHFELRADAAKLEAGSPPYALIAGLDAALGLLEEVGLPRVQAAITARVQQLADGLAELGCDVSPDARDRAGIVTFLPPGGDIEVVSARLHEAGYRASVRRGRIRVSPHFYNSFEEVHRFLGVVGAAY